MQILAIDPGPLACGVVLLDVDEFPPRVVMAAAEMAVEEAITLLGSDEFEAAAAERITGYAQKVGSSTFATCEVYGRIVQRCIALGVPLTGITRKEVKIALGLPTSAKGGQLNAVIKHTYPQTGGGATPAVGTKPKPGPLYGVTDHAWAALGVGLAWCLERERERRAAELEALKTRDAADGSLFDSTLQSEP